MKKGVTLVELIISIVIMAIAFYALINVFTTIAPQDVDVRSLTVGTHLLNEKMEEVMLKNYTGLATQAATSFNSPYNDYKYQVVLDYVTSSEPDVVSGTDTGFKRVKVRVWGLKLNTLEVVSLAATYEVQ